MPKIPKDMLDTTLVDTTSTQTLSSKTISGSSNTLSNTFTLTTTGTGTASYNGTTLNIPTPTAYFTWSEVTGTSQTAAVNNGYIANNAALVTITLPSTAAQGSILEIVGKGAGGWKIGQPAGDKIYFGSLATTTGTGGSLQSFQQRDSVRLVCITADTEWQVISSQGNITVV